MSSLKPNKKTGGLFEDSDNILKKKMKIRYIISRQKARIKNIKK